MPGRRARMGTAQIMDAFPSGKQIIFQRQKTDFLPGIRSAARGWLTREDCGRGFWGHPPGPTGGMSIPCLPSRFIASKHTQIRRTKVPSGRFPQGSFFWHEKVETKKHCSFSWTLYFRGHFWKEATKYSSYIWAKFKVLRQSVFLMPSILWKFIVIRSW